MTDSYEWNATQPLAMGAAHYLRQYLLVPPTGEITTGILTANLPIYVTNEPDSPSEAELDADDAMVIGLRQNEPSRPFREFLCEQGL